MSGGNEQLLAACRSVHAYATFCAPVPLQLGIAAALNRECELADSGSGGGSGGNSHAAATGSHSAYTSQLLSDNARALSLALQEQQLSVCPAAGGYFIVADVSCTQLPDEQFCRQLVKHARVGALPLSLFYCSSSLLPPPTHLVRFSICKVSSRSVLRARGDALCRTPKRLPPRAAASAPCACARRSSSRRPAAAGARSIPGCLPLRRCFLNEVGREKVVIVQVERGVPPVRRQVEHVPALQHARQQRLRLLPKLQQPPLLQQVAPDMQGAAVRLQLVLRILQQPLREVRGITRHMLQEGGLRAGGETRATCICVTLPSNTGFSVGGDTNHSLSPCSTCTAYIQSHDGVHARSCPTLQDYLSKHRTVRVEGHAAHHAGQTEGERRIIQLAVHRCWWQAAQQLQRVSVYGCPTQGWTRWLRARQLTCCHLPPLVSPNMYLIIAVTSCNGETAWMRGFTMFRSPEPRAAAAACAAPCRRAATPAVCCS